ncbi:MAG: NUDIX domain-containing protein [Cyanobacteria bacterium J06631_9]
MGITRWVRHGWQIGRTLLQLILRRPLVATSVVPLLPDGRIVLIRRTDNGLWGLPGGLIDWGEDVETAAKRELTEETGLRVVSIKRLVGVYSAANRDERFHSVCVALEATVTGQMTVNDMDEVLEVRAFAPQALPTDQLAHDHQRQLQDYLAGTTGLT